MPEGIRALVRKSQRTPQEDSKVAVFYRTIARELAPQRTRLAKLEKQLAGMKPITVPIMQEISADQERESFVQIRGNYQVTGEQVHRGTPGRFSPPW